VFNKMRDACLGFSLVSGADANKDADRYRAGMRHSDSDNTQPIIQCRLLIQYPASLINLKHILAVFLVRCQFGVA